MLTKQTREILARYKKAGANQPRLMVFEPSEKDISLNRELSELALLLSGMEQDFYDELTCCAKNPPETEKIPSEDSLSKDFYRKFEKVKNLVEEYRLARRGFWELVRRQNPKVRGAGWRLYTHERVVYLTTDAIC